MNKKKFILPTLAVLATSAALWGGTMVHAAATTDDSQPTSIIQRLVERFGLKTADVQAVFNEDRAAREATMQAKETERLDQLITDGKITEAQKQLIVAKRDEMKANRSAEPTKDSSLTPNQRKTGMEAQRTELETWAKANSIDIKYLTGFGDKGFGGHGMRGGEMPPTPAN